jgi:nucleoredoxin
MISLKTELCSKYGIRGIPTFVIIDGNSGALHTSDGRSKVGSDPDGSKLPWSN